MRTLPKIRGTALYFIGNVKDLSPYISQVFFQNEILYENNILVSIKVTEKPFGINYEFRFRSCPGSPSYSRSPLDIWKSLMW